MKTKIIYISGSEVFDAADIRAAFNEVRMALGLASDTVLFGVPVDADDAGLGTAEPAQEPAVANFESTITDPVATDIAQEIQIMDDDALLAPVKKTRKAARTKPEPVLETTITPEIEPIIENVTPAPETDTEKVIPILSILSSNADAAPTAVNPEPAADDPIINLDEDSSSDDDADEFDTVPVEEVQPLEHATPESTTQSVRIESVSVEQITIDSDNNGETITTQSVTIEEMMTDDMPEAEEEKTLERLLEKMTPLREDTPEDRDDNTPSYIEPDVQPQPEIQSVPEPVIDPSGIDATLEQLATEFVEKQDQIDVSSKSETTGKIGKLKNILPFKKAKREEPGLMGDLFGWAGIAANDDDFSIPGFFTTSATKK